MHCVRSLDPGELEPFMAVRGHRWRAAEFPRVPTCTIGTEVGVLLLLLLWLLPCLPAGLLLRVDCITARVRLIASSVGRRKMLVEEEPVHGRAAAPPTRFDVLCWLVTKEPSDKADDGQADGNFE